MAKVGGYWQETYLVSIARKGGSDIECAALCEEITFSGGTRPIAIKTLVNGGNLTQFSPMDAFSITMKIYPINISTAHQLFYGDTSDVAVPLAVTNVFNRYEMRAVITFTDDSTLATAAGATAASAAGFRLSSVGGFITNVAPDFSGKDMAYNVTIEFPPYTAAGVGTIKTESTTTAAILAALGAYS